MLDAISKRLVLFYQVVVIWIFSDVYGKIMRDGKVLCVTRLTRNNFFLRPAVCDMVQKPVAFHSESGVQYLCSLRQASLERKSNRCREDTPLLRERFTALFNRPVGMCGVFFFGRKSRSIKQPTSAERRIPFLGLFLTPLTYVQESGYDLRFNQWY